MITQIAVVLAVVFGILGLVCHLLAKRTDVHERHVLLEAARDLSRVFFLLFLLVTVVSLLPPDNMGVVLEPETTYQGDVVTLPKSVSNTYLQHFYVQVPNKQSQLNIWAAANERVFIGDTVEFKVCETPSSMLHDRTGMYEFPRLMTRVVKRAADVQPNVKE